MSLSKAAQLSVLLSVLVSVLLSVLILVPMLVLMLVSVSVHLFFYKNVQMSSEAGKRIATNKITAMFLNFRKI